MDTTNSLSRDSRNSSFLDGLIGLMLLIAVMAMIAMPTAVKAAQYTNVFGPNFFKSYTATLTNGQTLIVGDTNFFDTIRPGSGESTWLSIIGTNASVSNIVAKYDIALDGVVATSTWTTDQPFTQIKPMNGTTRVVNYTNFASLYLNNARAIGLYSLQNTHTNAVTVTVIFSHANGP